MDVTIELMFERLENILGQLQAFVEGFDASGLDRAQSLELYEKLGAGERMFCAAKALAGVQICDSNAWYNTHYKSPAHFMAAASGTTVSHQCRMLDVAELLPKLPETDKAFRCGALTEDKVIDLVSAAALDPDSEEGLLVMAEAAALEEFRAGCARVRHAASSEAERHQRAYDRRYLRHWIDIEGNHRFSASMTPEAGAEILAALEPHRVKVAARNSRRGYKGKAPAGAVLADALLEMAEHDRSALSSDPMRPGPRAAVHVRLDYTALMRGHTVPGEICKVPGVGPISVREVHRLLGDAVVTAVVMDKTDIRNVIKLGRVIPARLEAALIERDQYCVVPGCGEREGLENDHVVEIHRGGPTTLYNLARLCGWHHYLKTHHDGC
ncbi:HNH endonuclease signature motif containing protein [soil metagenome]